jgi:hypothetical protein
MKVVLIDRLTGYRIRERGVVIILDRGNGFTLGVSVFDRDDGWFCDILIEVRDVAQFLTAYCSRCMR